MWIREKDENDELLNYLNYCNHLLILKKNLIIKII